MLDAVAKEFEESKVRVEQSSVAALDVITQRVNDVSAAMQDRTRHSAPPTRSFLAPPLSYRVRLSSFCYVNCL